MLSLAAQIVPLLVAVATIPLLASLLGLTRLGILTLAWVVLGYAGVLDFGIARAATRTTSQLLAARNHQQIAELGTSALAANFVLGIGGAGLLIAITPLLVGPLFRIPAELVADSSAAFMVLALGIPVTLSLAASRSVLEGAQRFDLVTAIAAPSSALTYLLPALGAALDFSLSGIVALLVIGRVASLVGYLVLWSRSIPDFGGFARPRWGVARGLLGYGGWLTLSSASAPVIIYGERAIIASIITVAGLSLYVIPYELVARMWVVPGGLAAILFPAFSAMHQGASERIGLTFRRSLAFLIIVLGPAVVILVALSGPILERWIGADLASSATVPLKIFAVGGIVNSLGYVPLAFLQASGRADSVAKVQLAEIPATFLFTSALTIQFGLIGASVAWLARVVVDAVALSLMAWWASREVATSLRTATPGLITLIAAIGLAAFAASFRPVIVAVIVAGAIIAMMLLLLWRIGLTASDRDALVVWTRR